MSKTLYFWLLFLVCILNKSPSFFSLCGSESRLCDCPLFLTEFPAKIHRANAFPVFPFSFAEKNFKHETAKVTTVPQWPRCIHRIVPNYTLRTVWQLCDLRLPLLHAFGLTLCPAVVCVFWATSQSWLQPVSRPGQTLQTKLVRSQKKEHNQDQQIDLKTLERDKISTTLTAFAARHRRVGSAVEVIPGCCLGNWLAKINRSAVSPTSGW